MDRLMGIVKARFKAVLTLGGLTALIWLGCSGQSANSEASSAASPAQQSQKVPRNNVLETPEDRSGGLSDAQKASLKVLGIPIAIPLYVPDGFEVSQITTDTVPISDQGTASTTQTLPSPFASTYSIVYRNAQNTCLVVRGMDTRKGGMGGPDSKFELSTHTALLGEVVIGFGGTPGDAQTPTPEQLRIPQPNLSTWPTRVSSGPASVDISLYTSDDYLHSTYGGCSSKNTSITPLELEKVVQSMVLLK